MRLSLGLLAKRRGGRWLIPMLALLIFATSVLSIPSADAEPPLFLGVTTSTDNSGLLAHIAERFEAAHGIEIRAITAGSGAILNKASRGDLDVILVHSPTDEEAFVASGYGIDRRPVMRNRFIIVGPEADPAGIRGAKDVASALQAMAAKKVLFLSRGDDSGTHKAEQKLWQHAGILPETTSGEEERSEWYRETGSGQGATLNIASNIGAYLLTDEATFATFGNRVGLASLFTSNELLMDNVYSTIRVNPERHRNVNAKGALTFVDWLSSEAGQAAIQAFKIGGYPLFQPIDGLAG